MNNIYLFIYVPIVASTIGTSPSSENGRVDFCSLVGEDDSREGTHDIIDDNALFGQQLIENTHDIIDDNALFGQQLIERSVGCGREFSFILNAMDSQLRVGNLFTAFKVFLWVSEKAQCELDLSLILWTHMVGGTHRLSSGLHTCTGLLVWGHLTSFQIMTET